MLTTTCMHHQCEREKKLHVIEITGLRIGHGTAFRIRDLNL